MNEKIKKIVGAGLICLASLGAGYGLGFNTVEPEVINNTVVEEVPVIVNHTIEVPVEVPFETIVEVEKEVLVDNGKLGLVLDHIYDNNGNVEYLTDDLDDDEIALIADRVVFINDIKSLAAIEAEKEIKDLLDKEELGDVTFDEDDIERVRVQDDDDELIIEDVDFEDEDADVRVEVRFEQDDIKYNAFVVVEFKDGLVDDIDLDYVELRD